MNSAQSAAARESVVVIKPPSRWGGSGLRELLAYRELLYFLTKREVQIRYKQSLLGVSWVVLQPIGMAFMFALVFSLLDVQTGDIPFAVFALVGIVPWLFASQMINQGAVALLQDAPLLSRVYFPRLTIPIAKALGLMLDLGIALVVMIVVVLIYGIDLSLNALIAPLFLLLGVLAAFSMATLFAAINVKYRDMLVIVPIVVTMLLFLSPLIYPGDLVVGNWRYIYWLNPFAAVIDGMRWSLAGATPPPVTEVLISTGAALALFVVAILYFRRAEQHFADVV